MRYLIGLIVILLLVAAGAYVYAGRQGGPSIEIGKPDKFVGVSTPLDVSVGAPGGHLSALRIQLEQNGKQVSLYALGQAGAEMKQDGPDKLKITRDIGKNSVPELQTGAARITVTASRTVLYGMRTLTSTASKDVQVRLERPRVAALSTFQYVNLGGSEVVVYTASPADVQSGVLVGDLEYPGYPAAGAKAVPGMNITDPNARIAFFALRYDQDLNTPIRLFARDEAGNTARADFDFRVFPKPFKKSRIELDDKFLNRVVPAILAGTTEVKPEGDTLAKFLVINGELRRKNADKIASFAQADLARDPLGRRRLPSRSRTTRSSQPSPITALISTRARRWTSRCTSGSTSRHTPARRSSRRIQARWSSRTSWASTATA